jgi:hypothetical protein
LVEGISNVMDSIPWDSKKVRITISEKSIGSISSENLAPSTTENGGQRDSDKKWETCGLMAPVVAFPKDGPIPDSKPYPQLSQLLRDGPSKVRSDCISTASIAPEKILFS